MDQLRDRVPELLRNEPGQTIGGIASGLGVPVEIAQALVRPMVGETLETRGVRRGMTYYLAGEAPPDEEVEPVDEEDGDDASQGEASRADG